jgi:peptidoglycan hydrolase CwlO-like protein
MDHKAKIHAVILIMAVIVGSGCGPVTTARDTAKATRRAVDEYDQATAAVRTSEQKFYQDLADAIQEARQVELRTGLTNNRLLQTQRFTDYLAAKPLERATKTELYDFLLKATNDEQELFKRLRDQVETARASVLERVEAFEKRNKEIDAVRKQLDELSEGRNPIDTAKFLGGFFDGIKGVVTDKKTQ